MESDSIEAMLTLHTKVNAKWSDSINQGGPQWGLGARQGPCSPLLVS